MMGDKSSEMWRRMKEAFDGFNDIIVVSVSPWLKERAEASAILSGKKNILIYNGLETEVFHPYPNDVLLSLRHELGYTKSDRVVFHASPSFDDNKHNIKGGYYVLKIAEQMKDFKFLVAGKYDPSIKVPDNVQLLGNITDKVRMGMLYALSDVTVLTSKRETFSMVCAESLCCGTPVVGFKAGAPEMISLSQYSEFCEYADLDNLSLLVKCWATKEKDSNMSREAIDTYKREKMVEDYIRVYRSLLKDK